MNPELKTISYRGGVVSFRIPDHWQEEYDDDGGACFYEDAPDSPTFRLAVITAKSPAPVTADSAPDVLEALRESDDGIIERLPSGCAFIRYTQSSVDRGHKLFITYWMVAQVIPPSHARVATFSYTLLDRQRDDIRFQQELELLDIEIRASIFSPELGV